MKQKREWLVPAVLIALGVIPVGAGMLRLGQLATGSVAAQDVRFIESPTPIILHIVGSTLFAVLGALQFSPALRRSRWHRVAGRIALPSGAVGALSGLYMSQFFTIPSTGLALYLIRLVVGAAMLLFLVLGAAAIARRDFARHRVWLIRAYALGIGAGTQAFTNIPYMVLRGAPSEGVYAALMGAGWAINALVAEWIIAGGLSRPASLRAHVDAV